MVPSARTVPSAITTTGSQNSSMMASSCSTMRIVIPSLHSVTSSLPIRRARLGWTPAIGSSRRSVAGSVISARMISTSLRWPPLRSPA